jgi:hypothetical protein
MKLPALPVADRQPVLKRNPKTQRIVLTGLLLVSLDGLSRPVLTNRHSDWEGIALSESERKDYLISTKRGLRPVPRGTLK